MMTTLSDFDDDEQALVLEAPRSVLNAAVVADGRPSPMKFIKELSAGAKAFREAQRDENDFVRAVANAIRERGSDGPGGEGLPESEEAMATAVDRTGRAVALLRERADGEDAEAYGEWLVGIALRVSAAAKSRVGGLFGKRVAVAPGEQAFIDRLTEAVHG